MVLTKPSEAMKHTTERGKTTIKMWGFRGKMGVIWGCKNTSWQPN